MRTRGVSHAATGERVLAPVFDLANHRSTGATARFRCTEDAVELVAEYALSAGDEVSYVYDPEADFADLFERYGFFDEAAVLHTAEVPIPPSPTFDVGVPGDAALAAARQRLIAEQKAVGCDAEWDAWWVPDRALEVSPICKALRAAHMSDEELIARGGAAADASALAQPIAAERTVRDTLSALLTAHAQGLAAGDITDGKPARADAPASGAIEETAKEAVEEAMAARFVAFETTLLADAVAGLGGGSVGAAATPSSQHHHSGSSHHLAAAWYINLGSRADRREQMEAMSRARGLAGLLQRFEAVTYADAEVAALSDEFPGKQKGYHANACSHGRVWEIVARLDEGTHTPPPAGSARPCALIFEDDVCLHQQWRPMLLAALAELAGRPLDCFLLDGLYVTGELSAEHGWLGPPEEGTHRAEGVAFSDAYLLTPDAARWLVERRKERPGCSTESYLMQLQEERRATWTHVPRLALQRWDEATSSVCGMQTGNSMRSWFEECYFPRFPWSAYVS